MQKYTSKKRGHPPPEYNMQEFREWAINQEITHELYRDWVDSGFSKAKSISGNRIDSTKPYTFDNLEITTWEDNLRKNYEDLKVRQIGKHPKKVPVIKIRDDGDTQFFISQSAAARDVGVNAANIRQSCLVGCMSGGFHWEFADQPTNQGEKEDE